MQDFIARGRNIFHQVRVPDEKIFFIGFNKCGTTALHHLMNYYAIKSIHWDQGRLADRIEELHHDRPALRTFLSRSTSYSDITSLTNEQLIEGNRHFRLLHELYPSAYFILNDRNVENWIRSRSSHRKGTFLTRTMRAWNMDAESVKKCWKETHKKHTAEVTKYFKDNHRFLHFRIDNDSVSTLINFLSPSFYLTERGWKQVNTSKQTIRSNRT